MRLILRALVCAAVFSASASALAAAALARHPAAPAAAPAADTSFVTLTVGSDTTHAFVAWPRKRAGAPGIVVVHEWWGLNEQIRGIASRLSHEGYVAIVPDLYHGQVASDPELAHELSRALEDKAALGELGAAVAWLHARPEAPKGRIGVVGFCMGGGLSQHVALAHPELSAAVMFYGVPETDPEALRALGAPLLAHFGATDRGIPPSRADDLRRGLKAAGKVGEVYVYPGAGHGFMNETKPSYHPDAARQAWARTLAWFQRYLKG